FMLKEIHEQPRAIADTLRGRISLEQGDVFIEYLPTDPEWYRRFDRLALIACGTSWHAGLVGKYFFESLCRIPVEVDLASEYRYRQPVLDDKTLLVTISQSGETADTLAALKMAREFGVQALTICNVLDSSIPRSSDAAIYTHAGPEIGVASTKAFTTQIVALLLFAVTMARRRGQIGAAQATEVLEALSRVPAQMEQLFLEQSDALSRIAREVVNARSMLYLGRGPNFPIALEGALKIKEISYIHAEGYAAGEMKHGPIALIDEQMPVVVVMPKGSHYEKIFGNLEEVRARGARVIAIGSETDEHVASYADHALYVPDVPWYIQPLLTVVPLQLLAYYVADLKGTDVDQPRNLAKSVTVE
ncbi:MAG: glutamine--fructose-6-phosphate transaminase (isomerizing), partial [Myxococcales bacterium]|nr:glutamine--fructose-6-phosphate transaminase (isomerizing) [Myxococcales bacterium]